MADTVVVLEPGGERAQKIAKAMASQTAGDILRLIGEGQKTSTEISEQLALPMNTAKYHIENLLDAGLISVASTKYSGKGREVKVYMLTNQLLIVAPKQANVRSLLLKYASLFGIVAFGSLVIALLTPLAGSGTAPDGSLNAVPRLAAQEAGGSFTKAAADGIAQNMSGAPEMMVAGSRGFAGMAAANLSPAPAPVVSIPPAVHETTAAAFNPAIPATPDAALLFFLGGACVILVLVCYEVYLWRRMKNQ